MEGERTRERVSVRTLHLLTLAALLVVGVGVFAFANTPPTRSPRPQLSALDALPADNAFVATVDLVRLRQSTVGAVLTGKGRVLPGVGRLEDVCGFDPTLRIRELAIGVPTLSAEDGSRDFGIVATGDFRADRIAGCVESVIKRRGGSPVETQLGSFVNVRDRRHAGGEVAVRDGGPALLGGGSYLRAMVDAADRQGPSFHRDKLHAALRRSVGGKSTLVASWVLPPNWLEQVSGSRLSRLSPLSKVRAAALSVDFSPRVEARAVVGCAKRNACRQVADFLDDLGRTTLGPLLKRELGSDLAKRVRITTTPHEVQLHLVMTSDEARLLVIRALSRLEAGGTAATANSLAPTPEPASSADATPRQGTRPAQRGAPAAGAPGD